MFQTEADISGGVWLPLANSIERKGGFQGGDWGDPEFGKDSGSKGHSDTKCFLLTLFPVT